MSTLLYHANVVSPVTLVTTAETAVATTVNMFLGNPNQRVLISGHVNVTEGTGGTAFTVRLRQGNGTGGAVVGAAETDSLAAANSETAPFSFEDTGALLLGAAGGQYTITVQQTAATANGTVNTADIKVEAIP